MRRTTFAGSFLIVEGPTDLAVYRRVVDPTSCQVVSGFGKANAIDIIRILDADDFAGALAVVDADLIRLRGGNCEEENILCTDLHDLEITFLESPALEKVLDEYGSEQKLRSMISRYGSIRDVLYRAAGPVGLLRWANEERGYALRFEGLKFGLLVDKDDLSVNELRLISTLKNHSQAHTLESDELQRMIRDLGSRTADFTQVCCGHDVVEVLGIGLTKAFGSLSNNEVSADGLGAALRLAYEESFFTQTGLYHRIRDWEVRHPGFTVLKKA